MEFREWFTPMITKEHKKERKIIADFEAPELFKLDLPKLIP
jgi:hypothetical protein